MRIDMKPKHLFIGLAAVLVASCRGDEEVLVPSTWTQVTAPAYPESVVGFYLLNEGNMGSNKCTLDFFDCTTGYYRQNIYAETNPDVVLELGDVGDDMQVYGSKLYAVINCSNFVEVMDKADARHIGTITIPNCRNIVFHEGYAYVSSYAGPVQIDPNARLGYVAKVDTATFEVVAECTVGYQPEEMAVVGNKLYVANSGGYRVPDYDRTVSVIDLNTFTETKQIDVAPNLHRIVADSQGYVWVSSRGDYYDVKSDLYVIDSRTDKVVDSLGIAVSEMYIDDDNLYVLSSGYSYTDSDDMTVSYVQIDTETRNVITQNFITDGTDDEIQVPYGLAVNPETKEIYVTDAKSYVVRGTLYCFTPDGRKKWSVTTGDVPAHFAFLMK